MKKLFISCPMKNRSKEAIIKTRERMRIMAEAFFGEPLVVIDNYDPEAMSMDRPTGVSNIRLYNLGQSIKRLSEADYFVGVDTYEFKGCTIERTTAREYNIPELLIPRNAEFLRDCWQKKCTADCELSRPSNINESNSSY